MSTPSMPWAPVSDLSGIDLALPLLSHRGETWVTSLICLSLSPQAGD